MRVVVTGAGGFLGWHLRCALRAKSDFDVVPLDRRCFDDVQEAVHGADAVLHLAGVNRGPREDIMAGNVALAEEVAAAVRTGSKPVQVVYANSTQAGNGTPYGDSKASAASILSAASRETGASFADVHLPNLFGEHGRPDYNSFVATFCRDVVVGRPPDVVDREIPLLHVQRAAAALVDAMGSPTAVINPLAEPRSVAHVLAALEEFHALYVGGDIPPLLTDFDTDLFNTYRAAAFPSNSPIKLPRRSDARGELVECVRAHGGGGQTFVSTTVPGVTRGDHFHLRKVERFAVISGEATIALRPLFSDDVVRFAVAGSDRVAIDMPTMWAHSITNTGTGELITLFWTDTVFDGDRPDTFSEPVLGASRTLECVS